MLGVVTSNAALRGGQVVPSIGFAVAAVQLREIIAASSQASAAIPASRSILISLLTAIDLQKSKL
jgi:hypothetical protein